MKIKFLFFCRDYEKWQAGDKKGKVALNKGKADDPAIPKLKKVSFTQNDSRYQNAKNVNYEMDLL